MAIWYEDVQKADRCKPTPNPRDCAFWDEFARLLGRALEAQKATRAALAAASEAAEQERLAWWC